MKNETPRHHLYLEAAMQCVRIPRFLTLSAVIALWMTPMACSGDAATAPDQEPSFIVNAAGTATYVDDDGSYYCKSNYSLVYSGSGSFSSYDANQNGYICEYNKGNSLGRHLYVDDVDQTCKNGYGLLYSGGNYGDIWDFNGNDFICGLISKN